jgi:DNA ligase-1
MDTLDLVVTQATWGEGKRANWLTSFVISCVNENGELLEMGRCGTGFKELENDKIEAENGESNELVATVLDVNELSFAQMTRMIEPLIISQKGKEVIIKPEIILEIAYEEIQKSTAYSSGFALRFPRVIGLRDTRSVENASTIDVVEDYYYAQKKRQ